LWLDLGWWLSFLAFFGILIIAPQITARIYKEKPKFIGATLIETTAAQLMALPLIMWVFGDVSLISIIANALILPLVPLAMLFTFIAGTAGTLLPHAAGWLAWPAQYILSFMTDLIAIMSQLPYALVSVDISRTTMLIIYAAILFIVGIAIRHNKQAAPTYNLIE
jgi:competence protein ComEC